jgi:DNA polymerase
MPKPDQRHQAYAELVADLRDVVAVLADMA